MRRLANVDHRARRSPPSTSRGALLNLRSSRWSYGGADCFREGRKAGILLGDVCVLVVTAVARHHRRFQELCSTLFELCTAHRWVRVALNVFDVLTAESAALRKGLPVCVALSTISAFKTRFWQQSLAPDRLRGVTHLFLVDSDMDIRPAAFDLVTLLRLSEITNVSILSPVPHGPGDGFFNRDAPWLGNSYALTREACGAVAGRWADTCAVCRQPVVEVKSPLFTAAAWRVVYERLLSRMPAAVLTAPEMIDMMWCRLVEYHLDGCDPASAGGGALVPSGAAPASSRNCIGRTSCAYSYITPMQHLNDGLVISRWLNNSKHPVDVNGWLAKHAERRRFITMPSWRPRGSYLREEPCWTRSNLSRALANWTLTATIESRIHFPAKLMPKGSRARGGGRQ